MKKTNLNKILRKYKAIKRKFLFYNFEVVVVGFLVGALMYYLLNK